MASCSVFTIITILLYARHYVHANTIIADSTGQYNHGTINCAPNEDCTVICNATSSCYFADINCPANYACNIQCISVSDTIGKEACKTAKFHCTNSAECHILCQGDHDQAYTCQDTTFNWPTNNQYSLTCSGGRSCYGVTIDAPNNNEEFTFNCTGIGEGTCFQSTINCPTNADCNINCIGRYACLSLDVQCPISADSQCNVNCIGLESCQDSTFTGNGRMISCTGEKSCQNAILPTPTPNENLYIHCTDTRSCYGANITCPTNADCILTCTGQEACNSVSITWPVNNTYITDIICDTEQACNNIADPPSGPKVIGTTSTTTTPTPTTTTTTDESYGVILSLSFNYTTNSSAEDIDDILQIIIANIIDDSIINQSIYECGTYKININVQQSDDTGNAIINATVPLCNKEDVNRLISYFKSELESDLIDEIEHDSEIKLIAIHDVIIKFKEKEVIVPSTTNVIITTSVVNEPSNEEKGSNMIVIMMIVIICLLICIVLLLYYLYKKKIFMFSKNGTGDAINLNKEIEQELQHTNIKQTNGNMTTNGMNTNDGIEQDEDEGLYTKIDENNMITPMGDNDTPMGIGDNNDDVFNGDEEKIDEAEDEDMYLNSDNENETPQYIQTPGQRARDNTVPDLPPIDD